DLILLNLVGKTTDEVLEAGQRIRERGKYDEQTALIVMAEKYGRELEGTDEHVGGNDWVFYLGEELDQLRNLLGRLTVKIAK
ncbi:MAG: hypothetical protein WCD76_04485, partial [Pyrinomonadaceae bacterium]